MRGLTAPIIPAYLDRTWGSLFSYGGGRSFFRASKRIPHPVIVLFGDALPPETLAFDVRQKVIELGAGAFRYRLEDKMTLPEMFFNEMRANPFAPCVADSTGKDLNRLKMFLISYAVAKKLERKIAGDRFVGVLLPPSVGGVVANVALGILGKVAVNLNYTSSQEGIDSAARECGMRFVITARPVLEKIPLVPPGEILFIEDVVKSLTAADRIRALLTVMAVPRALSHRSIFKSWRNGDNSTLVTVVFTSGSTGIPKGVMLTHANISSNLEGFAQAFAVRRNDTFMGILPFFHSFGYTATLWLPLVQGIRVVYHANPLDAQAVGKMVKMHRATIILATPTFLSSYTRRCEKEDLATLRIVVVGAEKMKSSVAYAFFDKFGIMPLEGYGCTELSPIVSVNLPDKESNIGLQKAQKHGTIGLPLPGIAARVVDPETGAALPPGSEGMLLIKGGNVMKGYLNHPEKTDEVIVDGWYKTGDIAFLDEDGFITITDRLSRFSKVAGEMVPHVRIEDEIHAAIGAVEQVCVVSCIPDEKRGEKLVVLHVADMNVDDVRSKIKAAGLPNLWVPEKDMFFRIDAIPLLGSGKVDLGAVKKLAMAKAG
jgi:acyl-[acyl-carrier-protein]-phospholipid O-acyltransferase/long-chain-fatty-acid--[acyl-carrier-protein] ligase